jgi:hypothetical protein
LFQPERLTAILASVASRRADQANEVGLRVSSLQTAVTDAEEKLKRLYKMVEDGLTDLDDILKERITSLKLDRDRAKSALERIRHRLPAIKLDPEVIERFGRAMRQNITTGGIPFRKAYIQAVVDRVEVDDHAIRIIGDKATLEQVVAGQASTAAGVRSFVRKWRARHDSNV